MADEPRKPYLPTLRPGPVGSGGGPLPAPPPAGVLPDENSRLWVFTAKAIQQGEAYIQDDTREWFEERGRKVQITREYPDHPRWLIDGRESVRAKMFNAGIVSEIHMLARVAGGRPDLPQWVYTRMSLKQQGADLNFRLTKATRDVFIRQGKEALEAFATKAPGQFIKFVGNTFIPKKIETSIAEPTDTLSREDAETLSAAILAELKRREDEAKGLQANPLDYEAAGRAVDAVQAAADAFHEAIGSPKRPTGFIRDPREPDITYGLKKVVDLEADVAPEVPVEYIDDIVLEDQDGEINWDE